MRRSEVIVTRRAKVEGVERNVEKAEWSSAETEREEVSGVSFEKGERSD